MSDVELTKHYNNCPNCGADIIVFHEDTYLPRGLCVCPSCRVQFMFDSDMNYTDDGEYYYSYVDLITTERLDVPTNILQCELNTEVI